MYAGLTAQYLPEFDYRDSERDLAASGLPPEEILQMAVAVETPILKALGPLGSTVTKIIAAGALHIQECTPCRTKYDTAVEALRQKEIAEIDRALRTIGPGKGGIEGRL